jgi:hypothetical protein
MLFEIEWLSSGTIVHFRGTVYIDEINAVKSSLYDNSNFQSHQYSIFDYTEAHMCINSEEMNFPAATDKGASRYLPNFLMAMVAKEQKTIEICNTYIEVSKQLNSPWTFGLFENLNDAKSWVVH